MSINQLFSILKGGAGSGNIGHSGRLGHRGGSAPGKFPSSLNLPFAENYNRLVLERGMSLPLLSDELKHFDKIKSGVKASGKRKGNFGLCQLNAMDNCSDDEEMQVAVGVVFDKENIDAIKDFDEKRYWSFGSAQQPVTHVWNIDKDGKVVDTSLGSSYRGIYVGKIIPKEEVKRLTNNMTDSDPILDYARDLYIKSVPKVSEEPLNKRHEEWSKNR